MNKEFLGIVALALLALSAAPVDCEEGLGDFAASTPPPPPAAPSAGSSPSIDQEIQSFINQIEENNEFIIPPVMAMAGPPECPTSQAAQAPINLAAVPGDHSVTLKWDAPTNAACVGYVYNITYGAVGPTGEVGIPIKLQVWSPNTTINGLENGITHKFQVKAWSTQASGSADALVSSVPQTPCDPQGAIGSPTTVSAVPAENNVRLCWGAPKTTGCITEYRLAARLVPLTDDEVRNTKWQYQSFKTAGCMTLNGMSDKRSYQFAVQAVGPGGRVGSFSGSEATVVRDWRCLPVQNWYSLCPAATTGQCNPAGCAEMAKAGLCSAPWMRKVDWATKTVVQYCSEFCQCYNDDVLAISGKGGQPAVAKADGAEQQPQQGFSYDTQWGCCRA